ncbi:DUF1015 domain-containing protein [Saccharopolyspora halophila]|uniref:DUF1015 domain-containing protein n=1 Tax=Saccharopolyspora halophila TaxID=405551 RepID=A0ABN3GYY9_9PSEU
MHVAPFAGWRITTGRLNSLATRYTTPWDPTGAAPPAETALTLHAWQQNSTIVQDGQPALYGYEQSGPRGTVRGMFCAVHLDSKLLPHQDLIPDRITEICDLVHETGFNLDPLMLSYSGIGRATAWLNHYRRSAPATEVLGDDGQLHRLWPITDPAAVNEIGAELAGRSALIADGHHRHVAARQLRRDYYATGSGPGDWDYVPALVVDIRDTPLRLGPVHRVLPYTDPDLALSAAAQRFHVQPIAGELRQWVQQLREHTSAGPAFVAVTQRGAYLLSNPDRGFINACLTKCPMPLRGLSLSVLRHVLVDTVWRVPDLPEYVSPESSAAVALSRVRRNGGIAVLVPPPHNQDLRAATAAGLRLPAKSTSFLPKPHPGLLFRSIGGF